MGLTQDNTKKLLITLTILLHWILYTHPIGDTDVFWHLKTGEWIVKNLSIPDKDPFSFTTYEDLKEEEGPRLRYILSQYWLSQSLFYLSYKAGGLYGLILLRALILTSLLFVIGHYLNKKGVSLTIILAFIILTGIHLARYSTDRPQLFSFLFTALLLHELEGLLNNKRRTYFTIPLINLLWANMHATALMGIVLQSVYLYGLLIKRERASGSKMVLILLGVVMTMANPNTYQVIPLMIEQLKTSPLHFRFNTEYRSALEQLREGEFIPEYWIFLIISTASVFAKPTESFKRLLLVIVSLTSLYAIRFAPFLSITASLIAYKTLERTDKKTGAIIEKALAGVALVILLLTFYLHRDELLKFRIKETYPAEAIEYILEKVPSDKGLRLLNYFEWGGYILWRAPEIKTFIDGRVLRISVWDDYFRTVVRPDPMWNDRLKAYRIDLILLPLTRPEDGLPLNIMLLLLGHPEWKPLYVDHLCVIFARKDLPLKDIPLKDVRTNLLKNLRAWAEKEPFNPKRKEVIRLYEGMGREALW